MPVAYFPKESWVDAPLLTHTLISLARQNGADAYFGKPVEFVEMDGRRVKGVTLSGSTRLPADAVVNAAGPDADRIAATVERRLPLAPKSGLLVRVRTEEEFVSRLVHTPRVNLRPDGPRSLLLHHGSVDEKLAEGRPPEVLGFELLARAQEMVSELEAAEVEEVRVGVRPIPVDGYPCVGAAADISGYYEAVTHSGITLGPLVGRLLAQEVLTGKRNPATRGVPAGSLRPLISGQLFLDLIYETLIFFATRCVLPVFSPVGFPRVPLLVLGSLQPARSLLPLHH